MAGRLREQVASPAAVHREARRQQGPPQAERPAAATRLAALRPELQPAELPELQPAGLRAAEPRAAVAAVAVALPRAAARAVVATEAAAAMGARPRPGRARAAWSLMA